MKTYKIHLIRHGATDANILGKYIGSRTDTPLSPEGLTELQMLKQSIEYPEISKLYSRNWGSTKSNQNFGWQSGKNWYFWLKWKYKGFNKCFKNITNSTKVSKRQKQTTSWTNYIKTFIIFLWWFNFYIDYL